MQTVLGDFELIPLIVGFASSTEVAEVLAKLWGGDETLILISSDLSHYHDYETAQHIDTDTSLLSATSRATCRVSRPVVVMR